VWNRRLAQIVGILTFNSYLDSYKKGADAESGHVGHHSRAFASEEDEESQFVLAEGFRPGMTREALWRQHWRTLFGPGFHWCQLAKRLRTTFMGGSPRCRAAAWIWWLSVLAAASAAGVLVPLLLTLLLGLGFVGQGASWMEQASRHRWLIKTLETGVERHVALSHDRLLGAAPPPKGSGVAVWLGFAGKTLAALLGRVLVVQADLPHHPQHHRGLDLKVKTGMISWTDSAQAHSPMLWLDRLDECATDGSLHKTIDAWFVSLSKELAIPPAKPAAHVQ